MSGQSDRLKPVRTLSLCAAKCRGEFQRFARGLALLGEQRGTSAALLEWIGSYFRVSSPVTFLYQAG